MKKRIVSFLLVCFLCVSSLTAMAQTAPFVHIVGVQVKNNELSVLFRSGQAGSVTVLVYGENENQLLQVEQWEVEREGLHNKTLQVASSQKYVVYLGADKAELPKSVTLTKEYRSASLRIEGQETVLELLAKASYLTNGTVTRNGTVVSATDVVLPGDQIEGTWGEESYIGYAVVPGDVDLNSKVDAKDALAVLRYTVGKLPLTGAAYESADFSQNGKIDAIVALNILKFSVGKLKSL